LFPFLLPTLKSTREIPLTNMTNHITLLKNFVTASSALTQNKRQNPSTCSYTGWSFVPSLQLSLTHLLFPIIFNLSELHVGLLWHFFCCIFPWPRLYSLKKFILLVPTHQESLCFYLSLKMGTSSV
jgi:hypothetical protein